MNNQIDPFAISSRFGSFLLGAHNKVSGGIGLERNYHLIVAYARLRVASATYHKDGELQPRNSISSVINQCII